MKCVPASARGMGQFGLFSTQNIAAAYLVIQPSPGGLFSTNPPINVACQSAVHGRGLLDLWMDKALLIEAEAAEEGQNDTERLLQYLLQEMTKVKKDCRRLNDEVKSIGGDGGMVMV